MKTKFAAMALIGMILFGTLGRAQAQADVSVTLFYNDLSAYGSWVSVPQYGEVWYPDQSYVGAGWQPYTNGQWVDTDAGWTWVSGEPWGWATYHYGSWTYLADYGWVWIPGTEWGPAWVTWYSVGDYIGWEPLGPDGYVSYQPDFCCFVQARFFLSANIGSYIVPQSERDGFAGRARNVMPSVATVERYTGTRVNRVSIVDQSAGQPGNQLRGNSLYVYRPDRQAAPAQQAYRAPQVQPQQPRFNAPAQQSFRQAPSFHFAPQASGGGRRGR